MVHDGAVLAVKKLNTKVGHAINNSISFCYPQVFRIHLLKYGK